MKARVLRWPAPYRFAFGVTDDTDRSTTDSVRCVYEYCLARGIFPTRTTWVTPPRRTCGIIGKEEADQAVTLADDEYRALCLELQAAGIEMALHGVSSGDNLREEVRDGYNTFRRIFGRDPSLIAFHSHNADNAYWGTSFVRSRIAKAIIALLVPDKTEKYFGADKDSEYYSSDILFERVRYIRMFRTIRLNVLRVNPSMPYHADHTPDVRFWFSTTAEDLHACRRVTPARLDRLAREDGLFLLYAHMAEKFVDEQGTIRPEAARVFDLIGSREDCWKAGGTAILDRCLAIKNLIVEPRRKGLVIANPTSVNLNDLQIRSDAGRLLLASGEQLETVRPGVFRLPMLEGGSARSLYTTERDAAIGDPTGMPRSELLRMQFEEIIRLVYLRHIVRILGRDRDGQG